MGNQSELFIDRRQDTSPSEGKDKYGNVAFADPKNKKYPIDTEEHIRAAWNYIHKGANAKKYSPGDAATIKQRIAAAWRSKIDKAGPPSLKENAAEGPDYSVKQEGDKWCVYDGDQKVSEHPSEAMAKAAMKKMEDADAAEDKADKGADEAKEMALAHSNVIRGVEIFGTGTHNGDEYTERDLDDMVAAFQKLDVRPAIKIGHTKDKVGAPAYGWVTNLKRAGGKLLADFESMHDSVLNAIRKKSYDRVSSEIYFNLKRGGQTFNRALKAVALLGAEVPAVAGLVPLHKMEFVEDGGFDSLASCEQSLSVAAEALVAALSERVSGLINLVKEQDMSKNADQIAALKAKVATFEQQLAELKKSGKKDEDQEVKKLQADADAIKASISALEQADTDSDENAKLKARIAALEEEGRARQLKEKLAAIAVPAFRPMLRGLYEHAVAHPETMVKVYAIDEKSKKEVATDVSLLAQVDGIVAEINRQSEKLFKAYALSGTERAEGDDGEGTPGERLDRKVKEYRARAENKEASYEDAMVAVLKTDADLAREYNTEQGKAS